MALAFSDTTNKNGIIQRCETLLNLGDTGISGNATLLKVFTGLINSAVHKTVAMILESKDEWDLDDVGTSDGTNPTQTTYPVTTTPLVAGQRDYPIPASLKILKIKRVDITYDGTNWYKGVPWDSGETGQGLGNDTTTDGRFNRTYPAYDVQYNSIWIYPEANSSDVANGAMLRVEYTREFTEFVSTDTTKTLGIDVLFAPIVPILASAEWAMAQDLPRAVSLQNMAADYEARLKRYYGLKNEDRVPQLKAGYVNYH